MGSSITSWKRPLARSSSELTQRGWRSRLLGLKTTSGRRKFQATRRRSTWKKLAGVVQFTTSMLPSTQLLRKRSMRALLCSAPWFS